MYYKRYELQWRINLWFGTAIIGAAFGGVGVPHCPQAQEESLTVTISC